MTFDSRETRKQPFASALLCVVNGKSSTVNPYLHKHKFSTLASDSPLPLPMQICPLPPLSSRDGFNIQISQNCAHMRAETRRFFQLKSRFCVGSNSAAGRKVSNGTSIYMYATEHVKYDDEMRAYMSHLRSISALIPSRKEVKNFSTASQWELVESINENCLRTRVEEGNEGEAAKHVRKGLKRLAVGDLWTAFCD